MSTEVATTNEEVKETGLIERTVGQVAFSITDLTPGSLDLTPENNQVQEIELAGKYWTPEVKGESKIVVYLGIQIRQIFDEETGELTEELNTVNFAALENGAITQISNSSKRLVGIFTNEMFKPRMKFQVTYVGKQKSTKTGHQYDDWSVKPVISGKPAK